jgi:hypothetical protein
LQYQDGSVLEVECPAGYSQVSHLPSDDEGVIDISSGEDSIVDDSELHHNSTFQNKTARQVLKPVFDQLCNILESKEMQQASAPSGSTILRTMTETLHEYNKFCKQQKSNKKQHLEHY